jgi:hypothetical protein
MKNLKKVLAFVVVFAMMFTFAVSASPFPDVADDASYAEAATILNGIKIMIGDEQGNFNPDKTITRAEAATIIVRAKALGDAAAGAVGATAFTDVPASHWASGFINIATQSGIVAGYGDGTFGPEDPVTYEQMVKLIVAALGYTPKAEANGGYPTGYLVIASQEGITKGATGNAGDPAPRKTVARLVFNALDVDMMEQTVFSAGNEEYEKVPGSTLLKLLGISKYEGVVTGTYATDGKTAKDDKTVTVAYTAKDGNKNDFGQEDFLVGSTDAAALMGYNVVAYVDEDDESGDPIVIAIAQKSGKNDTIEIDYTQIDKFTITLGKLSQVKYYANANDKNAEEINIDAAAEFFYNGKSNGVASYNAAEEFITQDSTRKATIKPGKVKFVDNNGDDKYDFVYVTEYNESYVVDEVNESRGTITDKKGTDVGIDMDDEKVIYAFYKDGALASFEDIKEDDVITLAKSADEKFITVYISNDVVEGTVAEKTSDTDEYYRIDGDLYRLDKNVALKVGDEGKFFLNVDNRVVYKEAINNGSAGNYAILYDADLDTALGGNKMEIRYLTSEGKYENAYLANKVTVYQGNVSEPAVDPTDYGTKDMIEALYTIAGGKVTSVNRVLFKYQKNSAGDINKIYLADVKDDDNFSMDTLVGGNYKYKASTNKLGNVYLQNDAIVFSIPEAADIAGADEEDFTVTTVKALFNDDSDYVVYSYDEGDEGYPAVLVVLGAKTEIDVTTRVFVLTSIAKGNNANGQEVQKFYGYQEGKSVSAEESEDGIEYYDEAGNKMGAAPALKAGDAIIFSLDAAGTIDKIQVLMRADNAKQAVVAGFYNVDALDKDGYTENYFGRAIKKDTNNRLTIDTGVEEQLSLRGSDYNVYEVNVNKTTAVVNTSSYSAIDANATMKDGKNVDWVYVRMYDDAPVDIVVYTYTYDANL